MTPGQRREDPPRAEDGVPARSLTVRARRAGSRSATGARLLCSPRAAKWVLDTHPADEAAVLEILGQ